MPAGAERRLRAHVASVLAASGIPLTAREDLAEELFGHLAERWRALVAEGVSPAVAASEAIRDFGSARRIGGDLTRAYRGRLWASTIGALLPAAPTAARRPRIAWWLGASMRVYAVLGAVMTVTLASQLSPVRALLVVLFGAPAAALLLIGSTALDRRQRWALDLAIVVNVVWLVYGLHAMLTTPGLISLNAGFSALLLAIALGEREPLGRWVRRSRPVRNGLALAMLVLVAGAALLPVAARELPDPTQAGAENLDVALSIECGARQVELTADVRWSQTSLLPGGPVELLPDGLLRTSPYGDLLFAERGDEDEWMLMNNPELRNVATGELVAWSDEAYRPNQFRMDDVLRGPYAIWIGWDALETGELYRAQWVFEAREGVVNPEPLAVGVEYVHADRFRWETIADCWQGVHEPFVSEWP